MIREMLTGVKAWTLRPFCEEPPICLAQRMAGQLITQETWPGSAPQTLPSGDPMALPMAGRYKRVPWPLPVAAAGLVSSMLQLHPKQRPSAAKALTHDYFSGIAGTKPTRCHGKQAPTPYKAPRLIQAARAAAAVKRARPSAPQQDAFHTPPRAHAGRCQAPHSDPNKQAKAKARPASSPPVPPEPVRPTPWPATGAPQQPVADRPTEPAGTRPASSRLMPAGPPGPVADRLAEPAGTEPASSRLMSAGRPAPTEPTDRFAEPAGAEPASLRPTPAGPAEQALLTGPTGHPKFSRRGPSGAAAPDATDAHESQACQCKGSCGAGPSVHPWVAGRYAPCTSQLAPLPGSDPPLCIRCVCSTEGCGRQRRRGPLCFFHTQQGKYDQLGAPLRLMRTLAPHLGKLLPIDVQVFLEVARAEDHPAVLFILAQLWVPQAVRCFLACLSRRAAPARRRQGIITPAQLVAAVADAVQFMARHSQECEESLACQQSLQESGMQRLFGIGPVAQRLGVLTKESGGRVALHRSTRATTFRITRRVAACKELLALRKWGQPQTNETFAAAVERANADLQSLGSWARMQGAYLRPHVLRKVALLWHKQGAPNITLDCVPRSVWETCSPDQGGHLQCIPRSWSASECRSIAPQVPVMLYSMWACLLAVALREPGAEELMASPGAANEFRVKAAELLREAVAAPTPRQVIQAMLADKETRSSHARMGHP